MGGWFEWMDECLRGWMGDGGIRGVGCRSGRLVNTPVYVMQWWLYDGQWMDHMTLYPLQATAAGAGACGPRTECGAPPAALTDLPAQGREGPDHCGLCA